MPRTTEEILAHAEELARQAEEYKPKPGDSDRVPPEVRLRLAALKRAEAEAEIKAAVDDAREHNVSWAKVGKALGTSGQAASERYGDKGPKQGRSSRLVNG